jgi:hypothetical protein
VTYRVSITDAKEETALPVAFLYAGDDYQKAFDAAVAARSEMTFRGKWVKFTDGYLGCTKWAKLL